MKGVKICQNWDRKRGGGGEVKEFVFIREDATGGYTKRRKREICR